MILFFCPRSAIYLSLIHISEKIKIVGDTDKTGTIVTFKPDPEMFEETEYNYDTIFTRMREQAFLNAGLKISTTDKRSGKEQSHEMCYEGGIREFVSYINRNKNPIHSQVIYMKGERTDSEAEIALQYNDGFSSSIVSFANNIHTCLLYTSPDVVPPLRLEDM